MIAELDYSRGLNGELLLQLAEDAVTSATAGWALVETEPIKYSLQVASNTEYISSIKCYLYLLLWAGGEARPGEAGVQ